MSSVAAAFQSVEEGSVASHTVLPTSTSDDTCVTALEQRLMSDVFQALSSGAADFPGGSAPVSDVAASVRTDDVDRQLAYIWQQAPGQSQSEMDRLQQSVTTAQTAVSDVVSPGPMQRSQQQVRRVSADHHLLSSSAAAVDPSRLPQSGQYGSEHRTPQPVPGSSAAADASVSHQNVGQSAPKRRSSDQPCLERDAMLPAQIPKQRANSVHAVSRNTSSTQSTFLDSSDQSGNSGRDSFPFVAPRQRVHPQKQQTVAQILQSNAGSRFVSGRKLPVEPSSEQRSVMAERMLSGSGNESAASTKHVTFTDQKVQT